MNRPITPFVATALVGAGSLATIGTSVVAMKVYAVVVGPTGVGVYALLQSVLSLAILIASLGLPASTTALVAAAGGDGTRSPGSVARTALYVAAAAGVAASVVVVLSRDYLVRDVLTAGITATDLLFVASAVLAGVLFSVAGAVLAGLRRLVAATLLTVGGSLVSAAITIGFVVTLGVEAFAPAMAVSGVGQIVGVWIAMRRHLPRAGGSESGLATARALVELGTPAALSQVFTMGALLLVPVIVLAELDAGAVGQYRAAAAVSVGLGSVFLAGIHQDFLPRMSGAQDRVIRAQLINDRMRLVIGLALPILLALIAFAPIVVRILYTSEFDPAIDTLRWHLLGDVARVPTLVLLTTLFALRRRGLYLGVELLFGAALVVATSGLVALAGVIGAGFAYAMSQLIAFGAATALSWRYAGVRPGRAQLPVAAALVGGAGVLAFAPGDHVIAAVLGFGAAAIALAPALQLRQRA